MSIDVLVSEVGPRDGLQSIAAILPTAVKIEWIRAEAAAGVREIEVGSFVPAKVLPQLADTAEVVAAARTIPGLQVAVLVPNLRGAEAAVAAGAHKITLPLSVSETHSLRNLRRTHEQVYAEVAAVRALLDTVPADRRPSFEGSLSTAFGCTLEGTITLAQVQRAAERLMAAGCDEVGLADTTGYANPAQVTAWVRGVRAVVGDHALSGIHVHNTRGLGLANVLAGLEALRERQLRSAAGVRVVEVAEGWQLRTEPRLATWVAAIRGGKPFRLSRPTLETLAVVAFRQPVTKGDVDEVRGVDSGGILRTLLERGLVKLSGRSEEPGRPLLYGTSPQFLTLFGMRSLADLPTLRDLRVLGDEAPSAPLSAVVPFAAEELRGGLPPAV